LVQESESVYVTRAMGEYTQGVGSGGFAALPSRARTGELKHLTTANAFFDDVDAFHSMQQLTALNCRHCIADPKCQRYGRPTPSPDAKPVSSDGPGS
jgi:hypothetical protein